MMKKLLPLLGGLLFLLAAKAEAGAPNWSNQPTFEDLGNTYRTREVNCSSHTPVLLSSTPMDAGLSTPKWYKREFVNISTVAVQLVPDATNFVLYTSSYGVILSSDNVTGGWPKRYSMTGDFAVYGVCQAAGTNNTLGWIVNEWYWKPPQTQ